MVYEPWSDHNNVVRFKPPEKRSDKVKKSFDSKVCRPPKNATPIYYFYTEIKSEQK